MPSPLFHALLSTGLTPEDQPGHDCGDCYLQDGSTCRALALPLGAGYVQRYYPCGRVELWSAEGAVAAARLVPAEVHKSQFS